MVLMESRATLRKIDLREGLRDRFEPMIAEAVRAKRVTDTVSGLLRDAQLESFKL